MSSAKLGDFKCWKIGQNFHLNMEGLQRDSHVCIIYVYVYIYIYAYICVYIPFIGTFNKTLVLQSTFQSFVEYLMVARRYWYPDDPPVPILVPIWRWTSITWASGISYSFRITLTTFNYSHLHLVMRESISCRANNNWYGWWNRGSSLYKYKSNSNIIRCSIVGLLGPMSIQYQWG